MLAEYYTEKKTYARIGNGRKAGIFALLDQVSPKTVLDVGCGAGTLGKLLKEKFSCTVHGVDISATAINDAKKVLDGAYVLDIEHEEEFPKALFAKYDSIVISEVLEHLFFPEHMLERVKVFANESTDIIITVPNLLFWRNRMNILLGKFDYTEEGLMDRGHIHIFSWKNFVLMLRSAGFRIVQIENFCPTRGTRFLGRMFPGLFAYQFMVRVRVDTK